MCYDNKNKIGSDGVALERDVFEDPITLEQMVSSRKD